MDSDNKKFKRTDWLTLVTAIDIIGDMIAHKSALRNQAILENRPQQEIDKISEEIFDLGQESNRCYALNNHDIIIKAYTIYAPELKRIHETEKQNEKRG